MRPYKEAWPVEEAVDYIRSKAGIKFDPAAVMAFEESLPEILRIRELYRDEISDSNQGLNLTEAVYADTRWLNWDNSLNVGIDVMDEHHRYLFDIVNDLINVLEKKTGVREFVRVLKVLAIYAHIHFQAEERMMAHYHFDDIRCHVELHKQFQDKVNGFFSELYLNPFTVKDELLTYLLEWQVEHLERAMKRYNEDYND